MRSFKDKSILEAKLVVVVDDSLAPGRPAASLVISKSELDREVVLDVSELCALQALASGEPDLWERFGILADRVDNCIAALRLPMKGALHAAMLEGLRGILPEISTELKACYVAATGEDPWEE